MNFDIDKIQGTAIQAIRRVQNALKHTSPIVGNNPVQIHRGGLKSKRATGNDILAEVMANGIIHQGLHEYDPIIVGEELSEVPLENLDFTGEDRLVVLIDMVDGTDLFERRLSNWCSAMIFYHPAETNPEDKIIAAFVGLPNDAIYFARRDSPEAHKILMSSSKSIKNVSGPSATISITNASIAFYGQKIKNLLSMILNKQSAEKASGFQKFEVHPFIANLVQLSERELGDELRIYNLGGNPMMMRLIDGAKRIDGLFNLSGSLAHDVVPGLFIARKAGAAARDLNGKLISNAFLAEKLMKPANQSNRISFVLASTNELSDELLSFAQRAPSSL